MAARVITVFGGSGFIGRYLVQQLARRGWIIQVAVRHPDAALFLKPLGDVGQITPIAASLRHEGSIAAAVAGADAVINLVGILYERGRQSFAEIHAEGARRVAVAARAARPPRRPPPAGRGAAPPAPTAKYPPNAAAEAAVAAAFPGASIVRPSIVFGPEDGFFNRFAAMARVSPVLPLVGGGRTRFQPVYVGDVAEAIARIVDDSATAGRTYELGGPRVYSFRELLELMLAVVHRRRLLAPLPFWAASLQAAFLELLPVPPLTRDQVRLLQRDNVVAAGAPGLRELGIAPSAVELVIPTYLDVYRPGGRYVRA